MIIKKNTRGRPTEERRLLSTEKILSAAKNAVKEDGRIPSIRKLAKALNVDAMAIYHYFDNKQALLEAIVMSLMTELYEPDKGSPWKEEVLKLAMSYLGLLSSYPGLLETLLSMDASGPAGVFEERFRNALPSITENENQLRNALNLLVDSLHGSALAANCNPDHFEEITASSRATLKFYVKALDLILSH